MKKNITIICVSFYLISSQLLGQFNNWANYTYNFGVTSIAEENDYLWIGTEALGLIKFNKITEEINFFDKTNSGLLDYHINSIAVDDLGIKWIGTSMGLFKFDDKNWMNYNISNSSIASNQIMKIILTNNNKYIATDNGLVIFDNEKFSEIGRAHV